MARIRITFDYHVPCDVAELQEFLRSAVGGAKGFNLEQLDDITKFSTSRFLVKDFSADYGSRETDYGDVRRPEVAHAPKDVTLNIDLIGS